MFISIHTLTQRVTQTMVVWFFIGNISIHTLTQRVTEGFTLKDGEAEMISIHTLTQRVTCGC